MDTKNKILKTVLDKRFENKKFNLAYGKPFVSLLAGFINKNEEHREFFSSTLTGYNVVKFLPVDYNNFFEAVGIDVDVFENDLKDFYTVKAGYPLFGEMYYLVGLYFIHRFMTEPSLSQSQRDSMATTLTILTSMRLFTTMYSYRFKYPVSYEVAETVYGRLSGKFLIKKESSWYKVFLFRAKDIVDDTGLHYPVMKNFSDDEAIINTLNDTRNRYSSLLTNIYSITMEVVESGDKISISTNNAKDLEGKDVLLDQTNKFHSALNEVMKKLTSKGNFVQGELIQMTKAVVPVANETHIETTLNWICDNYVHNHKAVDSLIRELLTSLTEYVINKRKEGKINRIESVYIVRNYILNSRGGSELQSIKDRTDHMVREAIDKTSTSLITNTRTAIMVYLYIMLVQTEQ